MKNKQSPIIVGGGIAGLSTALALAHKGIHSTIIERCHEFQEVGAGLQLAPNATRILNEWGVLERLMKVAVEPKFLELRDGLNSKTLLQIPLQEIAKRRYDSPYITLHRADLHDILLQKVLESPRIKLKIAETLIDVKLNADKSLAIKTKQKTIEQNYNSPFIIGCDGVWSRLRQIHDHKDNDKVAQFSGYIAWRSTLNIEQVPDSFIQKLTDIKTVAAFMRTDNHLVVYPLKSGKVFNFVAITKIDNKNANFDESWSHKGDKSKLLEHFKLWDKNVLELFNLIEDWTYWPLYQMPKHVLTNFKNIAFVGDASHAMLPFAAQGAAMAIEDAASLAEAYANEALNLPHALSHYDTIRKPRLVMVNKRGVFNSKVYHATGAIAFGRNVAMKIRPAESFITGLDWLYKYDAIKSMH